MKFKIKFIKLNKIYYNLQNKFQSIIIKIRIVNIENESIINPP